MQPISKAAARAVIFDLDSTLFDHDHSVRSAISAVRTKFETLAKFPADELISKYHPALDAAYDAYLRKEITYEDNHTVKVQLFFANLGLPPPTINEVKEFRATYRPAYQASRRATAGSVQTLHCLRENGYSLAILTNGQVNNQTAKADFIGVRHLVDVILTSEEAGVSKPDVRIFQRAATLLGVEPKETILVGDSIKADIKGACDAQMSPILYSPFSQDTPMLLYGQQVPVIRNMNQLPELLGIKVSSFIS